MTPERWQQVEEVLQQALDRPPTDRTSFLDEVCAADFELRSEAASLLGAHDEAGDFIEEPALATDARVLIGDEAVDQIGRDIGPYTIVERLGAGGMGEVYLAQDHRLVRLVALKILPPYFASDDARLRRFRREAQAASALNHPNILTIHEVGEAEETRFIATEFIDGKTVRELIAARELTLAEILDVTEQVASALSAAHAAGIVHRDIKPENIMRRDDGLVKILDFGIAKLVEPTPTNSAGDQAASKTHTEIGVVMGTAGYMSPEQARALPVDERSDLWSLGVVLYEMLAERPPFEGATRMDTMVRILEREPAPLSSVPTRLYPNSALFQQVIDKTLQKDRDKRYQTASEVLLDLKNVRDELQHPAAGSSAAVFSRSPRLQYLTILSLVLLLVVIGGTILYRRSVAKRASMASNATVANKLYAQMTEAEKLHFVADQEQRISLLMGDRRGQLNDEAVRAIKAYVDRYVSLDARPDAQSYGNLNEIYQRAKPYVPLITRSFEARKVPVIIGIYLPMIESAYRSCYENSIGAKGLYQFVPQTAINYGVAPKDMCDAEKMTPAAAHFIADRMAELGEDAESVTLVLLSYNRGEESVRDMLRQLRGTANYERNFWTLFAHRNELDDSFRNESAAYVPNFFAAAIIGENPQNFGIAGPPLSTFSDKAVVQP